MVASELILWEDLVIAILSVNGWSVERTFALKDALRAEGLSNPIHLSICSPDVIAQRLQQAGYNRGDFMTKLLGLRLIALGVAIKSKGLNEFAAILKSRDPEQIAQLLLPISGVGKKVLSNFFLLCDVSVQAPIPSSAKES